MNPLEFFGTLHTMLTDKIQTSNKESFTKEEVLKIIDKMGQNFRKAIHNSSYVFNIEELNGNVVSIQDDEYTIKKLLTEEGKYLLFVQLGERDEPITDTDIQILAEEIQKGISKSSNISGVIIVPPNMDVSLITASIDEKSDIQGLDFTEEELVKLKELQDEMNANVWQNEYTDNTISTVTSMPKFNISRKSNMNQAYNNFFGSSNSTSTSGSIWYN